LLKDVTQNDEFGQLFSQLNYLLLRLRCVGWQRGRRLPRGHDD